MRALDDGLDGRSLRRLRRARPDARRPHRRARRRGDGSGARRRRRSSSDEIEGVSRDVAERLRPARTPTSRAGVRKQATLPEGAISPRARRDGAGRRRRRGRVRGRRAARARPASCGACGRAPLETEPVRRVLARAQAAVAARPALLRRERVGGGAGARRGRRGRRRGGGDDLRARLRDPRRPRRRAGGAEAARTSSRRRCAQPLEEYLFAEDGARDRGDRARPLPRARADAGDGRVVHRRARRRAADRRARRERRLPRRRSSPTRTT